MNTSKISFYVANAAEEVSFAKWLNVDEAEYAGLDISVLNLSLRSSNCLHRGKCHFVSDVLSLTLEDLRTIKNLGNKSADEVIEKVTEYINTSTKATNFKIASDSSENSTSNHAAITARTPIWDLSGLRPEMVHLLTGLSACIADMNVMSEEYESMSEALLSLLPDSYRAKLKIKKEFVSFFSKCYLSQPALYIPHNVRHLPVKPFLMAFSLSVGTNPIEDKVNDIDEHTSVFLWVSQLYDTEKESVLSFIKWLSRDLNELIKTVFDESNYDERQLTILKLRAIGKTLEEIGSSFNLTRERVRQLEKKAVLRFTTTLCANNFIPYIFAYLGAPITISKEAAEQFLTAEQINLLWWVIPNKDHDRNLRCSISEFDNGIVVDSLGKQKIEQIAALVSELPDFLTRNEMDDILYNLSINEGYDINILLSAVSQRFILYPEIYSVKKLTLTDMVEYLLRTKYNNGIHISNESEFKMVADDLQTCFAVTEEISQSSIINIVSKVGILYERGTYIHPNAIRVDLNILNDINDYIERQDSRTTFSYNELFEHFNEKLKSAGISNPYYLHGLLNHSGCPYIIGKDYVYKSNENSFDDDFVRYVKECYPISISVLAKHFVLSDAQCRQVLDRCKNLTTKGSMVFYRSQITDSKGI